MSDLRRDGMSVSDNRRSWGRLPSSMNPVSKRIWWRDDPLATEGEMFIARGNLRSYGDVADPVAGGTVADLRRLDRFIEVDWENGILSAESGVTLEGIIRLVLPNGWFLPVTPGTASVTLGGAIANDVHGKNHIAAGTFGHHVRALSLRRSSWDDLPHVADRAEDESGARVISSADPLFHATVGGLGLTGVIMSAELQLRPVHGPMFDVEDMRFRSLQEADQAFRDSSPGWEYVVAWVDATGGKRGQRRGWFTRARHSADTGRHHPRDIGKSSSGPVLPPIPMSLINGPTARAFNAFVARKSRPHGVREVGYTGVLYPLDALGEWSRAYGPRGFFQHQCALPPDTLMDGVEAILDRIAERSHPAVLGVLKWFGEMPAAGLLSFPMFGGSFAVDLPNRGSATEGLLRDLDAIVTEYSGRLYPAKDARMAASMFQQGYPEWRTLEAMRDPQILSAFWQRVSCSQ